MARVFKFGDDIDTDHLAPTAYALVFDPAELAKHCIERQRPGLYSEVRTGDVLVAGRNFCCGSSRERAVTAVLGLQVQCVIAHSFSRLFFCNAINTGLPILECPQAAQALQEGDEVEVDVLETAYCSYPVQGRRSCRGGPDRWTHFDAVHLSSGLPYIRDGTIRALAVTGPRRNKELPDVPTLAESGVPGFAYEDWFGFVLPPRVPPDIFSKLHAAFVAAIRANGNRFSADGMAVEASTAQEMAQRARADRLKWAGVVESARIERQ